MSKNDNKIKCNVETCKHNECKRCDLNEVKIGCNCGCNECNCVDDTICESFEEKEID